MSHRDGADINVHTLHREALCQELIQADLYQAIWCPEQYCITSLLQMRKLRHMNFRDHRADKEESQQDALSKQICSHLCLLMFAASQPLCLYRIFYFMIFQSLQAYRILYVCMYVCQSYI